MKINCWKWPKVQFSPKLKECSLWPKKTQLGLEHTMSMIRASSITTPYPELGPRILAKSEFDISMFVLTIESCFEVY